jgi:lipopolysaccharide transport system permease protein
MQFLGFDKNDIFLTYNLWKMNLRDRYLGSYLGLAWAILQPILLLTLYTFVFGIVLKTQPVGIGSPIEYVIWLFSGLIPYLVFTEAISSSTNSLITNASLIKNIVFKSETVPIAAVFMAVVPLVVGLAFIMILMAVDRQTPSWLLLLLIPVLIIQFIFLIGVGYLLSATAVFLRDIIQFIPTVTMALLFATPIFYAVGMMPPIIARVTFYNPLYQMVQPYRDIIVSHQMPDLFGLLYFGILSVILLVIGLLYFRKLKGFFEMVL